MTLFTFGPLSYPESLKMVNSISKNVKKIFVFYTAQELKSKGGVYNNCKHALSIIENYFDGVNLPCNCAFIKIWYEEDDCLGYPGVEKDVENPLRLPVFKLWSSDKKIEGVECLNAVKLNTYLTNEGFQCKPKQENIDKPKNIMMTHFGSSPGDGMGSVFSWN